jgi:hypothetical protein
MDLINEYTEGMKEAMFMASTGAASPHHAVNMITKAGIHGMGTLTHHDLAVQGTHLLSVGRIDVGGVTQGTMTVRNDSSAVIQTAQRLYLVSSHLPGDAPLSFADTRVVGPIMDGCALLVHTTGTGYLVTQGGMMRCTPTQPPMALNEGKYNTGDSVHIHPKQQCKNRCIQIGTQGLKVTAIKVDIQPAIHPQEIDSLNPRHEGAPSTMKEDIHKLTRIMHAGLKKDILLSEGYIKDIQTDLDWGAQVAGTYGAPVAAAFAATGIFFGIILLFLCVRYKRHKSKSRQSAQQSEDHYAIPLAPPNSRQASSTSRVIIQPFYISSVL